MEEFMNILWGALGTLVTGLLSWGVAAFAKWISTKIKDEKVAKAIAEIAEVGSIAVQSTYQTYVENIKGTDMWTEKTQKQALNKALEAMKNSLSKETMKWIENNFDNIEEYLINIIESTIYQNKVLNS